MKKKSFQHGSRNTRNIQIVRSWASPSKLADLVHSIDCPRISRGRSSSTRMYDEDLQKISENVQRRLTQINQSRGDASAMSLTVSHRECRHRVIFHLMPAAWFSSRLSPDGIQSVVPRFANLVVPWIADFDVT